GDEDVELAHRLLAARHQRLDRFLVGKIAGEHMDATGKLAGKRIERVTARARDRDGRALRMERARDRAADTTARTGDERALAGQIEHQSLPARRCMKNSPVE